MKNKLNELNIFALRDLARKTGVTSPTSKKKEDLINEIVEILSGQKKPESLKTKQGRPPKVFGYDIANVFNLNTMFDGVVLSEKSLNQKTEDFITDEITTVVGTIEMVNKNSAILWVEKDFENLNYFVSSAILQNINIKTGDRVVAETSTDENKKIIKKIFSVNDCPINDFSNSRKTYSSIKSALPNKQIVFNNQNYKQLNLKYGENCDVYGKNNNANTITIIDMLNNCGVENKIYVNISLAEKNKIYLEKLQGVERFVSNVTDQVDAIRRNLILAIERVKRIFEKGENVVIVVDDIASIIGVDNENINLIKNIISLARETSGEGSITLIAVVPNENFYYIEKLADSRLKILGELLIEKI